MEELFIYDDIKDLDYKKIDKEYDLIITSYDETAKLLKDKTNINVISIGNIVKELFRSWNNKEKDYSNMVEIRRYLEQEANYFSSEIVESFTKSLDSIYKSLKECKELRITVEEYEIGENNLKEELFLELMKRIYIQNSFIEFDVTLFNYDNSITAFKKDIDCCMKEYLNVNDFYKNIKGKIIIQGFYYITPIQEIVFNYFKKSGIEVVPIICYDERYKAINSIVDITFEDYKKNKLKHLNDDRKKERIYVSDVYAGILDGEKPSIGDNDILDSDKITFKYYDDLNQYNKDILSYTYNEKKEILETKLYAVNRKELLDRVSIFSGALENPTQISIKYYPIGIFLKEIYSTWKKNRVCLNMESLKRIFESNFLEVEGLRSIDYIEELNLIGTYFLDCEAIEDWLQRMEELKNNKSNIGANSKNKVLLDMYGPFCVSQAKLDIIKKYFNSIKEITDVIFFDRRGEIDTNIVIHLKNLCSIIEKNSSENEEDDKSIELELLKKIQEILNTKKENFEGTARNGYLFTALNLYVNDIERVKGEAENIDIYPFDSIEATDKNIDNIYIYDFDRDRFPQKKYTQSSFLSQSKLKYIEKSRRESSLESSLIKRQLILEENSDLIGRYVFWLALKLSHANKTVFRLIELDKDNKHFYQTILEDVLNKKCENANNGIEDVSGIVDTSNNLKQYECEMEQVNTGLREMYCYMYCPLRSYFARINNGKEIYVETVSTDHFIPSVIANIDSKGDWDGINLLNKFNQYSSVALDRFNAVINSNKNYKKNNDECFWLPSKLKIENTEKQFLNIDYLFAKFKEKNNNNIKTGVIPTANNGKDTCTYCSFKYICVEKDVNNKNYPGKKWIDKEENKKYLEYAKVVRERVSK